VLKQRRMMFRPKLLDTIKGYTGAQLLRDGLAGLIVGIVALPLAIAFGIASGVSPEKGLFTAITPVSSFRHWAAVGCRSAALRELFIVIVYGIVQQYGINGLIIATFLAGIMLIVMGMAGLGTVIKFIPYPLVVGFTSGIALVIFSSQMKDLLGLDIKTVPADFLEKWRIYAAHLGSMNPYAFLIALGTILITFLWPRITYKIPGSLIAILITTLLVQFFHLPVETIGSRFGQFSSTVASPGIPPPRPGNDSPHDPAGVYDRPCLAGSSHCCRPWWQMA